MPNPESVLKNEMHQLLWDFEIQMDYLVSARQPHLVIVNKKENLLNSVLSCPDKPRNIFNALKEAGEVISNGLLIAMVLKGIPLNFKPFTMVITQKKKTLTFS